MLFHKNASPARNLILKDTVHELQRLHTFKYEMRLNPAEVPVSIARMLRKLEATR